jgi:hypothetical protein
MSAQSVNERIAAMEVFLGVNPRVILEDSELISSNVVTFLFPIYTNQFNLPILSLLRSHFLFSSFQPTAYRAMEEYIWDAADAMEAELRHVVDEVSSRGGARQSSSSSSASGRSSSAHGESLNSNNSALIAETQDGIDALMRLLLDAQSVSSDMFEQYALKNVFAWPLGISPPLPSSSSSSSSLTTAAGGGGGELKITAPLKLYTAAQEAAIDERIAAAEDALNRERRRKRTLLFLRDIYAKRLPQAEQASEALDELVNKLKGSAGESTPNDDLKSFVARANRLKDLCERLLTDAPKEVTSAITTAAEVENEDEVVDEGKYDDVGEESSSSSSRRAPNSSARTSTIKSHAAAVSPSSNVRVRAANLMASASRSGVAASAVKSLIPSTPSSSSSLSSDLLRKFDESASLVGGKDLELLGREITKSARKA